MCLCVALRSGWSRLSLDVTSNIVTWPLELYYSWDQCWDSTSPDTGEPFAPEALPSVALSFLLNVSQKIIFPSHIASLLRLSCEHEKWECSPQGMIAGERQWGWDTQQWPGMCELVLHVPQFIRYNSCSLIHFTLHDKHQSRLLYILWFQCDNLWRHI